MEASSIFTTSQSEAIFGSLNNFHQINNAIKQDILPIVANNFALSH